MNIPDLRHMSKINLTEFYEHIYKPATSSLDVVFDRYRSVISKYTHVTTDYAFYRMCAPVAKCEILVGVQQYDRWVSILPVCNGPVLTLTTLPQAEYADRIRCTPVSELVEGDWFFDRNNNLCVCRKVSFKPVGGAEVCAISDDGSVHYRWMHPHALVTRTFPHVP